MICCHSLGAIVNISKSLLLFEETKKINTPIKGNIILNDACNHWSAG
jgi:hypothetical protein